MQFIRDDSRISVCLFQCRFGKNSLLTKTRIWSFAEHNYDIRSKKTKHRYWSVYDKRERGDAPYVCQQSNRRHGYIFRTYVKSKLVVQVLPSSVEFSPCWRTSPFGNFENVIRPIVFLPFVTVSESRIILPSTRPPT